MERNPALQAILDQMAGKMNLGSDDPLIIGSDHPYHCRCSTCLQWWVSVGPEYEDEDSPPTFGPFTQEEYLAAGGVL